MARGTPVLPPALPRAHEAWPRRPPKPPAAPKAPTLPRFTCLTRMGARTALGALMKQGGRGRGPLHERVPRLRRQSRAPDHYR